MISASLADWNSLFIFVRVGRFRIISIVTSLKYFDQYTKSSKQKTFYVLKLRNKAIKTYKKDGYFIVLQ